MRAALRHTGVTPDRAKLLTLHSFRCYLACALYGQGVGSHRICVLLRWKSEKSLQAYAKMTPEAYSTMISESAKTDIDCVITAHIPIYDSMQVARNLVLGHERSTAAAARDAAIEYDTDASDIEG